MYRTRSIAIVQELKRGSLKAFKTKTSLLSAVRYSSKEVVEVLREDKDESETDERGASLLMVALDEGNIDTAELFLNDKAFQFEDMNSNNVFHYALGSPRVKEVTKLLIDFVKNSSLQLRDFLRAKNKPKGNTPLHILAQQNIEDLESCQILDFLGADDLFELVKERNMAAETPIHLAAEKGNAIFLQKVLDRAANHEAGSLAENLGLQKPNKTTFVSQLLMERDEDSSTIFHLATQQKGSEASRVLLRASKGSTKYLMAKNFFGWTPFSCAIASDDSELVQAMLRGASSAEGIALVNQADYKNASSLHLAAKYGHHDIFEILLRNGADITKRGPQDLTALDIAIEKGNTGIVQIILNQPNWREAFNMPHTNVRGDLDTPFRKLIRKFPDLAETLLDKCYEVREVTSKFGKVEEVAEMNYEFIEDTFKFVKRGKGENKFGKKDEEGEGGHEVDVMNHPLMIMEKERRISLLQHPVCLALILKKWLSYGYFYYYSNLLLYAVFLYALNFYVLTSPSPVENAWLFNCSDYFGQVTPPPADLNQTFEQWISDHTGSNSLANDFHRILVITLFGIKVFVILFNKEFSHILSKLQQIDVEWNRNFAIQIQNAIPLVFIFDILVYGLSAYVAIHNFSDIPHEGNLVRVDVRSCGQWQVMAVTITFAWLNILPYMRLLYGVGKYIILFKDVISIFWVLSFVFFFIVAGFAFGFHLLLSNQDFFALMPDAILKTMLMMLGEYDFGDIFLKAEGQEVLPFPAPTYAMFIFFFALVSILSLNVLVGLTVEDIRRYLEQADLMALSMKLEYTLNIQRWKKRRLAVGRRIRKPLDMSSNSDLLSVVMIWDKIMTKERVKAKMPK